MKGSFYGLRAKELSLLTIALMCTTILIWAWEKTSVLTPLLPRQNRLQLPPDILLKGPVAGSVRSAQQPNAGKDVFRFSGKDAVHNQEDRQHLDRTVLSQDPPSNLVIAPRQNKVNPVSVFEEEDDHKEIVEAEGNDSSESQATLTRIERTQEKPVVIEVDSKHEPREVEEKFRQKVEANNVRQREEIGGNQACNYAKGKWVVDNRRPLYSGLGCKQWLSAMWSCRLTQRTDFAYEKIRWQPKNCEMEEFEGSKFLRRMKDKTLAFVGDSLGRQQFQSLMCMITAGKETLDVIDVGNEYGLIIAHGNARPDGWAFRFLSTNTTILYYWSASLCDVEPLDRTKRYTDYAMHLDRPPAFLRHFIHKIDVLVLNTGHHWNRGKLNANRWVMHVGGKPNTDKKLAPIWNAKNLTVYSIVNWVNSQIVKYPRLKAFYRSLSPRHFFGGEWNTGGSCDNTTPMSVGKEVLQDESGDQSAQGAVKGTGVKLLDVTALSQLRDEGHISRFSITAKAGVQDCLHWCLPGVPDTWNELLFAQI